MSDKKEQNSNLVHDLAQVLEFIGYPMLGTQCTISGPDKGEGLVRTLAGNWVIPCSQAVIHPPDHPQELAIVTHMACERLGMERWDVDLTVEGDLYTRLIRVLAYEIRSRNEQDQEKKIRERIRVLAKTDPAEAQLLILDQMPDGYMYWGESCPYAVGVRTSPWKQWSYDNGWVAYESQQNPRVFVVLDSLVGRMARDRNRAHNMSRAQALRELGLEQLHKLHTQIKD